MFLKELLFLSWLIWKKKPISAEGLNIGQRMYTKFMLSVAAAGFIGLGGVVYGTYISPYDSNRVLGRVQKIEAEIPKLTREISDLFRKGEARGSPDRVYQYSTNQLDLAREYRVLMSRVEVRNVIRQQDMYDKITWVSGAAFVVGLLGALLTGGNPAKKEGTIEFHLTDEDSTK